MFSEALLNILSSLYHGRLKAKHGWVCQTIPDSVYNNWSCAFHIRVPSEQGGGGTDKLISEIVVFNNNQSLPAIKTMLASMWLVQIKITGLEPNKEKVIDNVVFQKPSIHQMCQSFIILYFPSEQRSLKFIVCT